MVVKTCPIRIFFSNVKRPSEKKHTYITNPQLNISVGFLSHFASNMAKCGLNLKRPQTPQCMHNRITGNMWHL